MRRSREREQVSEMKTKWVIGLVVLTLVGSLSAEITEQKITATDRAFSDDFGISVSISGDYAIAGADGDDNSNGTNSGAAYIFERGPDGTWTEAAKLLPNDGVRNYFSGHSVSISGDYAIMSAHEDDDNGLHSGAAYIFERGANDSWMQKPKLTPSDAGYSDIFGWSVSISGNCAIVGARGDGDNGANSGSAYIFERATGGTWSQRTKLLPLDGAIDDRFGSSVSISGDYAIVGARNDDDNVSNSGSAYIFHRSGDGTWLEQAKLTASDPGVSDQFGVSVSISGKYAIAGARDDDNGDNSGAAYVFERSADGTWPERAKLRAADGAYDDRLGLSVSISGNHAIVGAHADDDNGDSSGSAYLFERSAGGTWSQLDKLTADDGTAMDSFGWSVSIDGGLAIVGAYNADNGGSAYVYEGVPEPATLSLLTVAGLAVLRRRKRGMCR